MKTELRLPSDCKEYYGDTLISNFDHLIDVEFETAIKNKPLFSRYAALYFNGKIWWNDKLGYWCVEVWALNKYVASYISEKLDELANEMDLHHGEGE